MTMTVRRVCPLIMGPLLTQLVLPAANPANMGTRFMRNIIVLTLLFNVEIEVESLCKAAVLTLRSLTPCQLVISSSVSAPALHPWLYTACLQVHVYRCFGDPWDDFPGLDRHLVPLLPLLHSGAAVGWGQ